MTLVPPTPRRETAPRTRRVRTVMAAALVAATASLADPAALAAQQLSPGGVALDVVGGRTEYDLSGVGQRNFVAVRARVQALSFLAVDPGVGCMTYRDQFFPVSDRRTHWFPEVQVQAELPLGIVRPYLGAGGGFSVATMGDARSTDPTLSVAGGVRVDLAAGWGAGGELRVRAIDPFHGNTADFGVSLSRRLR